MNKDQVKGRATEAKGKIKEVTGKALSKEEMENKGKLQNARGKVQAAYGDLKEDAKKAIKRK
ncbi:MAG: CsbD family protein [Xanthomonadales bacterium]|nr:CsbD family protein [Xanthomonadales bacterium]